MFAAVDRSPGLSAVPDDLAPAVCTSGRHQVDRPPKLSNTCTTSCRTSEDHKHMRCRIWWLACGNAEEAGSGRVTTARWSERGWSAAVGEGEVEESGWFG